MSSFAAALVVATQAVWPLTGDGQIPDGLHYDEQGALVQPYAVVYRGGAAAFDGSLAPSDLDGDSFPIAQITYIGATPDQAEALRVKIRAGVLGQLLDLGGGRKAGPVRMDTEQPTRRDDDVTPHLHYAVDLFRAFTTTS